MQSPFVQNLPGIFDAWFHLFWWRTAFFYRTESDNGQTSTLSNAAPRAIATGTFVLGFGSAIFCSPHNPLLSFVFGLCRHRGGIFRYRGVRHRFGWHSGMGRGSHRQWWHFAADRCNSKSSKLENRRGVRSAFNSGRGAVDGYHC